MNNIVEKLNDAIEASRKGVQTGKMLVHRQYVVEAVAIIHGLYNQNLELGKRLEEVERISKIKCFRKCKSGR